MHATVAAVTEFLLVEDASQNIMAYMRTLMGGIRPFESFVKEKIKKPNIVIAVGITAFQQLLN